eukprot:sb/3477211/
MGLAVASTCALVGMWGTVLHTNWLLEVRKCMERIGGGGNKEVEEIKMSRLDRASEDEAISSPDIEDTETAPLFSTKGPSAADREARITIGISALVFVTMVIVVTAFFIAQ